MMGVEARQSGRIQKLGGKGKEGKRGKRGKRGIMGLKYIII
jgi:hypothetical protein